MNTKFTILVAAGLLIAGISQAQGTAAPHKMDFSNPRHTIVREHRAMLNHRHEIRSDRHEIRKDRREIRRDRHQIKHHRKQMRHQHKIMKHDHRKF